MGSEKIGIVGGGVSGLSVAYTLIEAGVEAELITVFEARPTLGGNADTAKVNLGVDYRGADIKDFIRLADLGVNDINVTAYETLVSAMIKTGYCEASQNDTETWLKSDYLAPLEDTVCFFTPSGDEIWTKDGFLIRDNEQFKRFRGVVDMRFSLDASENKVLREAEEKFMKRAAQDFDPEKNMDKSWWSYSVNEYVDFFEAKYMEKLGIDADTLKKVVRLFLKPRISAMYFADDAGPDNMPFRGVMSYYRLQEGIGVNNIENITYELEIGGGIPADRRYFKYGSQHWINHLADWLCEQGVKIEKEYRAQVAPSGKDQVLIRDTAGTKPDHTVGRVVMACHADHQLLAFASGPDTLLTHDMAENLGKVQHSNSLAVAHTYSGVLPPDLGAWRTYNVMIREGFGLKSYQMTYVQNRHRNDAENPEFNAHGLPLYFVTLNPQMPIPDAHVLRMPTEEAKERRLAKPGYGDFSGPVPKEGEPAVATFRHVVMTNTLLEIQDNLDEHQGMANGRVYFAGCWTLGAGLHEECFKQAEKVVDAMGQ